ncbi:glutathione S-transferase N-terminal domain-containing protein [Pandoraea sp.]|uniref:glutathione S-transferase family protein n=1 Tax=Pandoraea sp. TaxID=1883445 RepID=UPI001212E860|nr:glutathione S-transferase N-terminal domain-containing protein [Pandoraea sp.]TAL56248.1 MAG: glutathione S-transferase family protein [Pandoraea sp.]TAM19202.1 MAG: glutathione S-transferase family protein [Pandoraea sp.]
MQLYGRRSSINVQKVIWCLAELGLMEQRDYQRIDAGLDFGVVRTPQYLALNPNGLVPTWVEGDLVLWESNSIVRYLAATRGDGALLPADPARRADVERWMDWQLGTLWATLRVAFLGLTRTPLAQRNHEAIKTSFENASRQLEMADAVLARQPFITSTGFTAADIVIGLAVHRWIGLLEQFAELLPKPAEMPSLLAWHRALTGRPAFIETVRP